MSTVSMFTEVFPTVDYVLNICLLSRQEKTLLLQLKPIINFQIRLIVCVISFIN